MKRLSYLIALLVPLFSANAALAGTLDVTVSNDSTSNTIYLQEKGLVYMTYYPEPSSTISASSSEQFSVVSTISTVDSIKLVYSAQNTAYPTATCTFEYSATQDYMTGLWTVQWLRATSDYDVINERMYCDSSLSSFNSLTGDAVISFDARYYEL